MTTFGIVLTIVSVAFFTALVLVGAWIDGRRQKLLEAGKHPLRQRPETSYRKSHRSTRSYHRTKILLRGSAATCLARYL